MNESKLNNAISKLSKKELADIFPPITRNNFVVRENWYGRNQIITFVNNKGVQITYNHDEVYNAHKERFESMNCFAKYKSYTNSNAIPAFCRDLQIK